VALEIDEIADLLGIGPTRSVPEVIEADLHERGQRLVGGDVAAQLRGDLVGANHHADGVPAHDRAQAALDPECFLPTREGRLERARDGVDVRGVEAGDRAGPGVLGALDDPGEQVARAVGSVMGDDRVQGLEPLGRLYGVGVDGVGLGSVAIRARCLGVDSISHGLRASGVRTSTIPSSSRRHGRAVAGHFGVA
jgi:hypothetical protein